MPDDPRRAERRSPRVSITIPRPTPLWPWPCRRYCGACGACERAAAREVWLHSLRRRGRWVDSGASAATDPPAAADPPAATDPLAATAVHAARFGAEVDQLVAHLACRREDRVVATLTRRLEPLARAHRRRLRLSTEQSHEAASDALAKVVLALRARLALGMVLAGGGSRSSELAQAPALRNAVLLTFDWPGWVARIVWNEHVTIARRPLTPLTSTPCLVLPLHGETFGAIVARAGREPSRHGERPVVRVDIEPNDVRRKATLVRGRLPGGSATVQDIRGDRVMAAFSTPRRQTRMVEILDRPRGGGEHAGVLVVPDDPRRRGCRIDGAGRLIPIVEIYESDVCSPARIALPDRSWPAVLVRPARLARVQIEDLPPELPAADLGRAPAQLTPALERVLAFVAELPIRGGRPTHRRRVATDLLALCPELPDRHLRAGPLAAEVGLARAELSRIPEPDTRRRIAIHLHGTATDETVNNVSQVRLQLTRLVRHAGFARDPDDPEPEDPELLYGWAWLIDRTW